MLYEFVLIKIILMGSSISYFYLENLVLLILILLIILQVEQNLNKFSKYHISKQTLLQVVCYKYC